MSKEKRKAYSYVRMSTSQQLKGDSLRRQAEKSEQYAKSHDFELVEKLEDIGLSAFDGKNVEAGALGIFLTAIEDGLVPTGSVLLIESLDRLSRQDVLSALDLFNKILSAGISIVTLDNQTEYTKESLTKDIGKLFLSLGTMFRANEESETKSRRLKAAWESKRSQAGTKKLTSIAPAWLKSNSDRTDFVPIKSRVQTVREIFRRSIQGYGAGAIAVHLNENISSYPPFSVRAQSKGKKPSSAKPRWHKSYVQKILGNPAVYGEYQPHVVVNGKRVPEGDPVDDYFPEIVSKEDFLLCKSRIARRRVSGSGRKGISFSNLFTRMIVCGSCGGSVGFRNKGQRPKGGRYLRCTNSESHFGCDAPAWRYEIFEQNFLKWISEVSLEEIVNPDKLAQKRSDLRNHQSVLAQEIDDHGTIYQKLRVRLAKVPDAAVDDVVSDIGRRKAKIDELEEEKEQVALELAALSQRDSIRTQQDLIDHINQLQKSLSDEKKKELRVGLHNQIQAVVESITIHNGDQFMFGDDVDEMVPEALTQKLRDQGVIIDDPKELEDFFSSESGRRLFNEHQRHFSVKFKNGTMKTVYPDQKSAVMTISDRMAQFIKKARSKKRPSPK